MAHTKSGGSTVNNRDSVAKRLGVKLYAGQKAKAGNIIVRQKGSKFFPGLGVLKGNDFTIYAVREGIVSFRKLRGKKYIDVKFS